MRCGIRRRRTSRLRFRLGCALLVAAALGAYAPVRADAPSSLEYYEQVKRDIRVAEQAGDADALLELQAALKKHFGPEEPLAYLAYYWAAYVDDRIVFLTKLRRPQQNTLKYLDEGAALLEQALKRKTDFAEGYILLASFYGQKASMEMLASFYGPKATYTLKKALEIEADNPRAYLIDGIGKFYTPQAFGGGLDKALRSVRKAKSLFPKYRCANVACPDWGYLEAHAWLGQIQAAQGEYDDARGSFREGLSVDPNNAWLKALLSQLETQLGSRSR